MAEMEWTNSNALILDIIDELITIRRHIAEAATTDDVQARLDLTTELLGDSVRCGQKYRLLGLAIRDVALRARAEVQDAPVVKTVRPDDPRSN